MQTSARYLRTVVFGISDSLVSTVGLLAGIDVAGTPHKALALTGIVYAFVEAFSMAVGNYLSEESADEYAAKGTVKSNAAFANGVVMFIVFVLAAFIPIVPYLIFSTWIALAGSVALSIFALFVVGLVGGKLAKLPLLSRGMRMAALGGAAIVIGVIVGSIFPAGA